MSFLSKLPTDRYREICGIFLLLLTAFVFFALITDGDQGAVRRSLDEMTSVYNLCGKTGAVVAGTLTVLLGYGSHVLYVFLFIWSLMLFRHKTLDRLPARIAGMFVTAVAVGALLHLDLASETGESLPGGACGAFVSTLIQPVFGLIGSNVILMTITAVGILLATEFLFLQAFKGLYAMSILVLKACATLCESLRVVWGEFRVGNANRKRFRQLAGRLLDTPPQKEMKASVPVDTPPVHADDLTRINVRPEPVQVEMPFEQNPVSAQPAATPAAAPGKKNGKTILPRRKTAIEDELPPDYVYPRHYTKPSRDLLDPPPPSKMGEGLTEMLRSTSVLLENALQTHGIEARVTDVTRGPTITRYELEPAPGIKVSKFLALADDLALALKALGVRVEAPIPGKGRIGIEMPNSEREPVVLRDLLESKEFRRNKGPLVLALGKDITGEVVTTDLASMPHLLVAGATGSGKTVCIKSILASLLFNKNPDELQLVLVDPKMVELSIFNDIPHLITPVVTDPKKAAAALNWLIAEMEERYQLFTQLRVRNIDVYNESVENGEIEIPETDVAEGGSVDIIRKLPYIVCVIDELADLMMLARAEVEDAIMRLAQLARAVGIHLIIATQRPSVNVLTGVIKANFPVRIAFQVSSKVDSRCILDEMGAERLIGKGDMLYLPAGQAAPTRIQSAFVSDNEMNGMISYLKTQAPPQYRDEIENWGKTSESIEDLVNETDELFDEAVRVVIETGQASISMVQRRLRVGYTRAARLIDMMELKGIVGPHVGSKAREILVDCAPTE
ncbi:MAG: DNA translocase FtsK [Candidatus Hydrogenedentes bacterium]|nr:DNA translocase FtsK [Candidatus Hydrogenedentota bacterium]